MYGSGKQLVGPIGERSAKIALIGEAPAREELRAGRPFVGEAGRLLDQCLHTAGIIRGQCYITNLFKYQIDKNNENKYISTAGLKGEGLIAKAELLDELEGVSANIFVPMGKMSMCALIGETAIVKRRGYLTVVELPSGRPVKVLPTLHPASALYGGKWINLQYIGHDLIKAKGEADSTEPQFDSNIKLLIPETYNEAAEYIETLKGKSPLSFDIEVVNYEVSCIGFTTDPSYSISIPFYQCWTDTEESDLWVRVARILEDPDTTKLGQNLIFDIHFLLTRNGIKVKGDIIDTMLAHHIIYPDMLKSLNFLASIYVNRPYWKDMVKFKNIKKES